MKTLIISQARISSSRLPKKVLKNVGGMSLIECHIHRLKKSKQCDDIVIAVADEVGNQKLINLIIKMGVEYFVGNTVDVLDRFYFSAKKYNATNVVRVTSDCPLIDAELLDSMVGKFLELGVDYLSNTLNPTFPDGVDVEIFKFSALEKAWKEAKLPSEREHVTPYIWKNSTFKCKNIFTSYSYENIEDLSRYRLTVDLENDLVLVKKLIEEYSSELSFLEYVKLLNNRPDLTEINKDLVRNEGYLKSIAEDNNDK